MRSTKRVKGITDIGLTPRPIRRVGVLGGGLMGSGIATSLILAGCQVLLKEINETYLQNGLKRIQANLQSQIKKGRLRKDAADRAMALVRGVLDYGDFKNLDMVIEAALEDIPLKQQIFADLEEHCNEQCILATNTSTIDITVVGQKTRAADRIVGAHFFSPAHLMPLLEIVRSEHTSKQVFIDSHFSGFSDRWWWSLRSCWIPWNCRLRSRRHQSSSATVLDLQSIAFSFHTQ